MLFFLSISDDQRDHTSLFMFAFKKMNMLFISKKCFFPYVAIYYIKHSPLGNITVFISQIVLQIGEYITV